jgi:penicillin-binding protein 1A
MTRFLFRTAATLVALILVGALAALGLLSHYDADLPDHRQLATYEPPVTTRVYAGDGRLLAEYAAEKRVFVPIQQIPQQIIDAFLAAEDKNFYEHAGVDPLGVLRAAVTNLSNLGTERRPMGASTITQQVAKNFLLSNEISIQRKIKEAILAYRMDRAFSKERILELYLNQIYLGHGSYGVAAAAMNYFDKSPSDLTLAEAAFLAALPKGPNNYDPVKYPDAARSRRDWVITRMQEDGRIQAAEAQQAMATPLVTRARRTAETVAAGFYAEEVRRDLAKRYGDKALYEGGLSVHSTLDPRLQAIADRSLRAGLEAYDRRHGWRGPIARLDRTTVAGTANRAWQQALNEMPPLGKDGWRLAVVLGFSNGATIGLADGTIGRIPLDTMRWARPRRGSQGVGAVPARASDVLEVGDVVAVEAVGGNVYALRQIPAVDGALTVIDPHTGRVLAMTGGWAYERSQFNRATQAARQPGSAFKPLVYLAALESGYTPASIVLDAPVSYDRGPGEPAWSPQNYSNRYYGPTTMRVGIEQSRNVMTVRLADAIGMDQVVDAAKRLGVVDDMPPYLAYALGAGETTLLRLTAAYAMFVNGGHEIVPSLIDRIQDRYGRTIFRHDPRPCPECRTDIWSEQPVPELPDLRPQATDPHSAYQIVSMLEGVVERGTGKVVSEVGKPLAGKTGTSNDSRDTWFIGFSPDLAVGVFVGFDEPATLGSNETGGSVAAPIFRDFMKEALADTPAIPFRIPPEIRLVRVNAKNGRLTEPGDPNVILEAFKPGTVPMTSEEIRASQPEPVAPLPSSGTGGLY